MDIRELRSFVQVAHAGSFTRAAKDLYIAQPALSRQIAKLEEQLNVVLLTRHGRGVELTAAGARLLERAEMVLHYFQETCEHVRNHDEQERGHLAVGLPPAIGAVIGPYLIKSFRQHWPQATLHVREGLSGSLQEWLLDGRIDVAVIHNQPLMEAFEVKPLFSEPMMLVGPPGEVRRSVRIHEFADLPLILPSFPHFNRRLVEQAAVQNGVKLNIELEIDSVHLTKRLVQEGLGYTILANAAVQDDLAQNRLCVHPIERPGIRSVLSLATLRDRRNTWLVAIWENILTQHLRVLVTEGAWKNEAVWLGD